MKKTCSLLFVFLLFNAVLFAQQLRAGFDKEEYAALMKVSAQFGDSGYAASLPPPQGYKMIYRSPEVGFYNRWDFWQAPNGAGIVSIRGTVQKDLSWLANFYAAMVPAKGTLQLSKTETFNYNLSDDSRATVHVGWLAATGFLAKDVLSKIDSAYKTGMRSFYIMGHSQGGAIGFLLTAYLAQLQKHNALPKDIRFKTYCSAGPKPGNLYFAYDYEAATQGGWAFNVVNAADWVPQTPFSVQTVNDFVDVNPFANAGVLIKNQNWPKRWMLKIAYSRLKNPSEEAASRYRKYLGGYVFKAIHKSLTGLKEPAYAATGDYVRTGSTVVLMPHDDYYKKFPQRKENIFVNHFHQPYLYLTAQLTMDTNAATVSFPEGEWELVRIEGADTAQLFALKKPFVHFDNKAQRLNGNTGCNNFNTTVQAEGTRLRISENIAATRMACPGNGEQVFLQALAKVNAYATKGDRLLLLSNDNVLMEFTKKQ